MVSSHNQSLNFNLRRRFQRPASQDYSLRRTLLFIISSIALVSLLYIIIRHAQPDDVQSETDSFDGQKDFWNSTTSFFTTCVLTAPFHWYTKTLYINDLADMYTYAFPTFVILYTIWFSSLIFLLFLLYKLFFKPSNSIPKECLKDDIIVITGGLGTLGTALAKAFLRSSATVILLDKKAGTNLSDLEVSTPGRLFTFPCDVANADQVSDVCQFIVDQIGVPTVLINGAAINLEPKVLWETSPAELHQIFSINCFSIIWLIRVLLPKMVQQKRGHIINISSCIGLSGTAFVGPYCSTKAAVYIANESLRREIYNLGLDIKLTVVCPYYFQSNMFHDLYLRWPKLLKPLKVDDVSNRILKCIVKAKNSQRYEKEIWLPWFVQLFPYMKMLPTWVFDLIFQFMGANNAFFPPGKVANFNEILSSGVEKSQSQPGVNNDEDLQFDSNIPIH